MANKEQQIQHAGQLLQKLEAMAQTLRKLPGMVQHEKTFTPEQFGYTGSGKATDFLQKAIDAAAEKGGTVKLEHGDYLSGTLVLRSLWTKAPDCWAAPT